jgi:hypothetical protein
MLAAKAVERNGTACERRKGGTRGRNASLGLWEGFVRAKRDDWCLCRATVRVGLCVGVGSGYTRPISKSRPKPDRLSRRALTLAAGGLVQLL